MSGDAAELDPAYDCYSCDEEPPDERCPSSRRPCGHHCNHSWTHDECCWCGAVWSEELSEMVEGKP